jgi:cell division protein FtsB
MRRAVRVLLAVVIGAAVLLLFVFPVRTLIDQRSQAGLAMQRLKALTAENAQLGKEAQQLHDKSYLEQIARDVYGLARPGDHVYQVTPPNGGASPTTTTTVPGPGGAASGG